MKKNSIFKFVAQGRHLMVLTILLSLSLLLSSCSNDLSVMTSEEILEQSTTENNGTSAEILEIPIPAVTSKGFVSSEEATRATLTNDNFTIYDLWILQLDETDTVLAARYIENYADRAYATVRLYPMESSTIIYVANTNNPVLFSRLMSMQEVFETTYLATNEASLLSCHSTNGNNVYMMSGIKSDVKISEDAIATAESLEGTIVPNAAKITYSVSNLGSAYDGDAKFVWEEVGICNTPAFSSYTSPIFAHDYDDNTAKLEYAIYPAATTIYPAANSIYTSTYISESAPTTSTMVMEYIVPVNMRGKDSSGVIAGTSTSIYGAADWSMKAELAQSDDSFRNATYFYMKGKATTKSGNVYNVTFCDYIGDDSSSYNVVANHHYQFSLSYDDILNGILNNDARFYYELVSDGMADCEVSPLPDTWN